MNECLKVSESRLLSSSSIPFPTPCLAHGWTHRRCSSSAPAADRMLLEFPQTSLWELNLSQSSQSPASPDLSKDLLSISLWRGGVGLLTCFLTYSTNNSRCRGSSHFWLKKVLQRAAASPWSSERIPCNTEYNWSCGEYGSHTYKSWGYCEHAGNHRIGLERPYRHHKKETGQLHGRAGRGLQRASGPTLSFYAEEGHGSQRGQVTG